MGAVACPQCKAHLNQEGQVVTETTNKTASADLVPFKNPLIERLKNLHPNSVIMMSTNREDDLTGYEVKDYNGTPEDAVQAADALQSIVDNKGNWGLQTAVATGPQGKPKWVISPNRNHVAEFGTAEADYILGDLNAYRRRNILSPGTLESIKTLEKAILEDEQKLKEMLVELKTNPKAPSRQLNFRSLKEEAENLKRIIAAIKQNLAEYRREVARCQAVNPPSQHALPHKAASWYSSPKMIRLSAKDKVLAIDLDNTLAEDAEFPKIGKPRKGAKKAMQRLREAGFKLAIYTCRLNGSRKSEDDYADQKRRIEKWLERWRIPFDELIESSEGKPFAEFYIDDRSIEFKDNWKEVADRIIDEKVV